jgi:polyisoprenoid-binding protein YceI
MMTIRYLQYLKLTVPFLTLIGLEFSACTPDPSQHVAKAKVEKLKPSSQPKPTQTPSQGVKTLALKGVVSFEGSKVTGSHTCDFSMVSGEFKFIDNKIEDSSIHFRVQAKDFVCDKETRTQWTDSFEKHLRGEDFFAVEKYPTATFVSNEIRSAPGEGGITHTLSGALTIRGVTKTISFPAIITYANSLLRGRAEFSIQRKDFGIVYPGKPDNLIRDGVILKIDLSSVKS